MHLRSYRVGLDWARFNVPPNTLWVILGPLGTGFYGSNNLTNSVKAPKKDRFLVRIRLQSHQVHPACSQ